MNDSDLGYDLEWEDYPELITEIEIEKYVKKVSKIS